MPGFLRGEQDRCRIYEQLGLGGAGRRTHSPGWAGTIPPGPWALAGWPLGARVLELGCGSGTALSYLISQIGLGACGIDPSPVLLGKGRCRAANLPMDTGIWRGVALCNGIAGRRLGGMQSVGRDGCRRDTGGMLPGLEGRCAPLDPRCLCPQPRKERAIWAIFP